MFRGTTEATLAKFGKLFCFMHMFIASVIGLDRGSADSFTKAEWNRFLQLFSVHFLKKTLEIFRFYHLESKSFLLF